MDSDVKEHNFCWTTDNDEDLVHERLIDGGSFADVHKVVLMKNLANPRTS